MDKAIEPEPAKGLPSISYSLEPRDMVALNAEVRRRSRWFRLPLPILGAIVCLATILCFVTQEWASSVIGAVVTVVLFSAPSLLRNAENQNALKTPADKLAPRCLTLAAEGVATSMAGREEMLPWRRIRDITVREGHLFFFTDRRRAIIVPAPAFSDREAFAAFLREARHLKTVAAR